MSNLPPGVNVNMIPGNRPEDMEEDAFWDELDNRFRKQFPDFYKQIEEIWMRDEYEDAIMHYILTAVEIAYNKGYNEGSLGQCLDT